MINDKDRGIYNLYKTAKNTPSKINNCKVNSNKSEIKRIKNKSTRSACDVIKLHKNTFGATGTGSFIEKGRKMKVHINKKQESKLDKTTILNNDFKVVSRKYNKKGVVQYWDPPYVNGGKEYNTQGVSPKEVCDTAKKIKNAKVVISYDNNSEVKKSCRGLKQKILSVPYVATTNNKVIKKELLITNY